MACLLPEEITSSVLSIIPMTLEIQSEGPNLITGLYLQNHSLVFHLVFPESGENLPLRVFDPS